jgi:chemotaxis protein methyltransferase CheR
MSALTAVEAAVAADTADEEQQQYLTFRLRTELFALSILSVPRTSATGWVVDQARSAQYAIERAHQMPQHYLVHYCLKGIGSQAGTFRIEKKLRRRVRFLVMNLNTTLP